MLFITKQQEWMHEIGVYASQSLMAASQYGHVVIVTNSDEGWVEYSAQSFIPFLVPDLEKYTIISARTRFQKIYPARPLCWKAAAFAHEVTEHFVNFTHHIETRYSYSNTPTSCNPNLILEDKNPQRNYPTQEPIYDTKEFLDRKVNDTQEIISFGDSLDERTALTIVASQLDAIPKSVTFLSSPTPLEIIGQLKMVAQHMEYICYHPWSMDLELTIHSPSPR